MANEFRKFLNFVRETTGRYPEKFANSFQNIYIYVPGDKTPPDSNASLSPRRTVSLKDYFSTLNEDFRRLVSNEGWDHLEDHLGSELLRFCLEECVFAKKTESGFLVSSLSNFRDKITAGPPGLNQVFYISAICCKEDSNGPREKPAAVLRKDRMQKWKESWNGLNHLFSPRDIEISTDGLLFKIYRRRKFPKGRTTAKRKTETTMSSQVIRTQVGDFKIVDYEACVEPLELILKRLKKLHNEYNYEKALSELVAKKAVERGRKTSGDQNLGKLLPLSALKMYFTNICRCVIPRALFSSNKNINTVVKIICELLESPKTQSVSLKPFIPKMRISDMTWLSGVKYADARWCILGKLLKWLFNEFILEIFRTQLYIMVTNSSKKIYFMQRDWQKLTTRFLRKMHRDKVIVRTSGLDTKVSCGGRWTLFPKRPGVRPIVSGIRRSKQLEDTKLALCYLQQLYTTKYGESDKQLFVEKWKNLVDKFRSGKKKTMYLVCCDIQYAYESIDQKKLVTIVESLADSTGPELRLKCYKIARSLKAARSGCFDLKKCFTYPELELPVPSKSIVACGSDKVVQVNKKALIHEITRKIFNQTIVVSKQRYLLQEGIAQGSTLSCVLCSMYYAHMEEANLSRFKDEGFLYRYADDFLYATEVRASAERFLQLVNKGFPEYNCSFNAAKTRSNLPGYEHNLKDIPYLGYNIDPETLEVTPEYSINIRYKTVLSKPRYKVMEIFHQRLSNLASLKLDGIILDSKINSEDTIVHNIKCVFTRQAACCLWLLKALFLDDIPSRLGEIFRIIKLTNLRIVRQIQLYFLDNDYDFERLIPRLAVIPWKSYREVFGKVQAVYIHFQALFLKSIKMIEQAVTASSHDD